MLGGPIVRDKAHFFGSVERILLDSSVTTNIPTRPDLNRTDFEISRVWNTFLRGDHQLNAGQHLGHPLAARDLAAAAADPGRQPHAAAARSGNRRRLDGRRQPQLGDRVDEGQHVPRLGGVRGRVLRQSDLQRSGHDQKSLLPQLNYLIFQDQQSARANRRLDVAYGADNVFAWFVPGKGGDHDLKFGVNYLYSSLRMQDFGNVNGTFTINTDLPFDRNNPRTYPERLSSPRAGRASTSS